MLNFSTWIKDHYIHTQVSEIVSLCKERWLQLKADWSFLVLKCSNCAHQRLFINKRKTKTSKPDMLNHLHTETVSRSPIWAPAITGHDDFLFISFGVCCVSYQRSLLSTPSATVRLLSVTVCETCGCDKSSAWQEMTESADCAPGVNTGSEAMPKIWSMSKLQSKAC